jgi:hypothetical protein
MRLPRADPSRDVTKALGTGALYPLLCMASLISPKPVLTTQIATFCTALALVIGQSRGSQSLRRGSCVSGASVRCSLVGTLRLLVVYSECVSSVELE